MKRLYIPYKLGVVALLVALLAGMLPARPSLAHSAQRPISLSAEQPVDVPSETVRAGFWVANAMHRVEGSQRAEMMAFELVLMHLYKQNPDLAPEVAVQKIRDLQAAYQSAVQSNPARYPKAGNEGVLSVFAVLLAPPLSSSPAAGAIVAAAHEVYALTLRESTSGNLIGAERILGASETYLSPQPNETAQQTLLHEALDVARRNQRFGQAFDTLWAAHVRVSIYADTKAIIASSPPLQSLSGTIGLIDENTGEVHTTAGYLQSLVDLEFLRINQVLTDGLILLKDISDGQKTDLVDAAADTNKKKDDKARASEAAKKASEDLGKAKADIVVIAKLAKYLNKDWGEMIEKVGTSTIEIADSISKFVKLVADVGALQALTSIGTLALTGNIVGAVTTIISLFANDGGKPKPDKQLTDQIAKLRDQVKALSKNMNSRFDRVDKALNQIYATLINRFDRIDLQLGVIHGNIQEIQTTLSKMQKQLDRMEQHIFVLLSDGFQHALLQQMNGSIGYKERTLGQVLKYEDYSATPDGPENTFQSWATLFSEDALAVGPPTSPPYDDLDVYAQLTLPIPGSNQLVRPLDTNINFFSQYINDRWGLPALSSATIVNPRIWSLSARAYTELGLDWPAHALRIAQSRTGQIAQKGLDLQEALRKISTIDTPSGPAANHALFDRLIANYITKTAELDQAVQDVEKKYLVDLQNRNDHVRSKEIDPWGGVNQPLDPSDLAPLMDPKILLHLPNAPLCGHTDDAKPLPSNFARTMLPAPFQVAYYLVPDPGMAGIVSAVKPCYDARWIDLRVDAVGWPEPHDVTYAKLQVDLIANYMAGGTTQALRTRSITFREQLIDSDGPDGPRVPPDPRATAKNNWEVGLNIKLQFETASLVLVDDPMPPAVLDDIENALKSHQQGIYQAVINELAGIGSVGQAAKRLTGAKALLDVAIGLGLPRALEVDEYLRSFLYGSQALLNEAADRRLAGLWLAAKARPPSHNARADIIALMGKRADALNEALAGYLSQIDAGRYVESHRMIDTTLDRLKVADFMIRTPFLSQSAGSLSFGYQLVGQPSATRTITLTNSGLAAPINFGLQGIDLEGANADDFAQTNTCGTILEAGAHCTIMLTFTPTAPGARAAELWIGNDTPDGPHSVSLAGTGWLGAAFNAPASVAEGDPIDLSLTDLSNPNQWEPGVSFAFDCGSGYGAFGPSSTAACPTTDNDSLTVKGKLMNLDGGVSEYSAAVTVANVAPTASLSAPATVAEGSPINLALRDAADPSSADMASLSYAFDCGNGYGSFGPGSTTMCPTTDNGGRTVKARVKDKDGGVSEYGAAVTIANVAPSAVFEAPNSATIGHPFELSLANTVDAPADLPTLQYAFDCSDGAGYGAFGPSSVANCSIDTPGVYSVRGKVQDKDGAVSEYNATVLIEEAISITIISPGEGGSFAVDSPIDLSVAFTERVMNTAHTCTISWGDDTEVENGVVDEANGMCTAKHAYASPGQYIIKVAVENSYGDSSTATVAIVVKSIGK
jgi:hypothetical protein